MVASATNLVLWLAAMLLGIPLATWPTQGSSDAVPLGPLIIIGATLFASVLAGLLVGIMGKLVKKLVRWVIVGGLIVTAASLSAPWDQPHEVPTSTRVILTLMHLATGALVVFGLSRGVWTDDRSV